MRPPQPRLNFFHHEPSDTLWIIHRKVASSSLRHALGVKAMLMPGEAKKYANCRTFMPVRHPWQRITTAIINTLGPYKCSFAERIQQEILGKERVEDIDWHVWPQWYGAAGFRVDDVIPFENLPERWGELREEYGLPRLPYINKGRSRDIWHRPDGDPYDWSPLLPTYDLDFGYCERWKKT